MRISERARQMTPFMVMEILEAGQRLECEGAHVVHLEVGEPDFDTPQCIKDAACRAMNDGQTHYTHSMGIPELRRAISDDYRKRYDVDVDPDRILVTQGTSPAMLLLFSALLQRGDKVILSDPCYACYENFIRFSGGEAVKVPVFEEDAFQFRVARIREKLDGGVRAILINSPSNPTGTQLSPERMQGIADLTSPDGPYVVSDEIYHGLVYEGRDHSILEFTDNAFVLNGFSKLYAMTGWRLGYIIAPEPFVRPMQVMAQNLFISANAMAQWAGVAALTEAEDDVARMKAVYNERRVYMIQRLRAMGFSIAHEPTGAFYVIVNAKHLDGDSLRLAYDILEKAHVGVTPGVDFGEGAEGYIRFSYANSIENIGLGMDRLERYVNERLGR